MMSFKKLPVAFMIASALTVQASHAMDKDKVSRNNIKISNNKEDDKKVSKYKKTLSIDIKFVTSLMSSEKNEKNEKIFNHYMNMSGLRPRNIFLE